MGMKVVKVGETLSNQLRQVEDTRTMQRELVQHLVSSDNVVSAIHNVATNQGTPDIGSSHRLVNLAQLQSPTPRLGQTRGKGCKGKFLLRIKLSSLVPRRLQWSHPSGNGLLPTRNCLNQQDVIWKSRESSCNRCLFPWPICRFRNFFLGHFITRISKGAHKPFMYVGPSACKPGIWFCRCV